MKVFIHKIHMGSSLPSVKFGGQPYQIYGHGGYSDLVDGGIPRQPERSAELRGKLPQSQERRGADQRLDDQAEPGGLRFLPRRCEFRHWHTSSTPSDTTPTHLPQIDDTQCAGCHIPQGELPFDASIIGAHTVDDQAPGVPGLNFTLTKCNRRSTGEGPDGDLHG